MRRRQHTATFLATPSLLPSNRKAHRLPNPQHDGWRHACIHTSTRRAASPQVLTMTAAESNPPSTSHPLEISLPIPASASPAEQDAVAHPPLKTTLYYVITAPHAPHSQHHSLLLSVSFHPQAHWLRTRFLRTPSFFARREQLLPPPFLFVQNLRIHAQLRTALPLRISPRNLVTQGPTALSDALSLSPALANVRGVKLACPPIRILLSDPDSTATCALALASGVRPLRAFLIQLPTTSQQPTRRIVTLPARDWQPRELAPLPASASLLVLAAYRVKSAESLLTKIIRSSSLPSPSPLIHVPSGTQLLILDPISGDTLVRARVQGLLTRLIVLHVSASHARVAAIRIDLDDSSNPRLSFDALHNLRTGHAFTLPHQLSSLRSRPVILDIPLSKQTNSKPRTPSDAQPSQHLRDFPSLQVCDFAHPFHAHRNHLPRVYTVYNLETRRAGILKDTQLNLDHTDAPLLPTATVDTHPWYAEQGDLLSGPLLSPDQSHVSVLLTNPDHAMRPPRLLLFELADIPAGPVSDVPLPELAGIGPSAGGVWTDWPFEWSEENAKIVRSAYELFEDKKWNDIDSGFSSLGLRL